MVLSSPSAGATLADYSGVVTIVDNEAGSEFSISGTTVVEGGTASLTITRSGSTGAAASVNFATIARTATSPSDFGATSGLMSFSSGEATKSITIPTVDDTVFEGLESFGVTLSGASSGAIIVGASADVSLQDNDAAPNFAVSNASATEGGSLSFTVTKSGSTANTLSVNFGSSSGTALEPNDYQPVSGALNFLPAETSKTITVTTVDDTVFEATETFSVYLSGASGGAVISSATGTGSISNNDVAPVFSVANVSVTEGGVANIVVTRTGASEVSSGVTFATSDGTAGAAQYAAASGTLNFVSGETSKSLFVSTTQNVFFNLAKTFNLTLSAPTNATLGATTALVTINNDDPPPSFAVVNPTARPEGQSIVFGIQLDGTVSYEPPLTINYATSSGTATSGVDFQPTSGTVTFTSPNTLTQVTVPTIQDSAVEPDETIIFTISSPSYGAAITQSQATGTITNDDAPPSTGPVANTDNAGSFARCATFTVNPITNDTDPGGNYPLSLVSVAPDVSYTVAITGNSVTFQTLRSGARSVPYTVTNSIGGQATGMITWTTSPGPVCP